MYVDDAVILADAEDNSQKALSDDLYRVGDNWKLISIRQKLLFSKKAETHIRIAISDLMVNPLK